MEMDFFFHLFISYFIGYPKTHKYIYFYICFTYIAIVYLSFYSILSVNKFVIGDHVVLLKVLDDVLSIRGRLTVIKGISLFLSISIYAYQLLQAVDVQVT